MNCKIIKKDIIDKITLTECQCLPNVTQISRPTAPRVIDQFLIDGRSSGWQKLAGLAID